MTSHTPQRIARAPRDGALAARIALVLGLTIAIAGCRDPFDAGEKVTSWTIADHAQRHPILVSQQPATVTMHVERGAYGLSPAQRSRVLSFLGKYRTQDAGNSKISIKSPSGSINETASMHAVHEIRRLAEDYGFDGTTIQVEAYDDPSDPQPPVRLTYMRYVAEGPDCGLWDANLSESKKNLPYPDFGCSDQSNLAAMVANPADLLGPRTMTPRPGEVRDQTWDKFKKGESTVSTKRDDERVRVRGAE